MKPHPKAIPASLLESMYLDMMRIRLFEERLGELIEAGEVTCPCHLSIGQEAVATGVCAALDARDYVWSGHRSHGHYLAKGGSMRAMMAEILGRATGCSKGRGGSMHLFAPEVGVLGTVPLVAATIPLAVGAGLASKLRGDGRVSVAFFGDGATEEGHFHESLNLAALHRLPVIFVCENNFYASHMQLLKRRAKDNIPVSGKAHGMPGIRVDGNDVVSVYIAAAEAAGMARSGEGPTLIECRTYRWRGHVGPSWDMDVGVKRKNELRDWLPKDPVAQLRKRMIHQDIDQSALSRYEQRARAEVEDALAFGQQSPYPDPSQMMNYVFGSASEN